jgi:hypothetical protein
VKWAASSGDSITSSASLLSLAAEVINGFYKLVLVAAPNLNRRDGQPSSSLWKLRELQALVLPEKRLQEVGHE